MSNSKPKKCAFEVLMKNREKVSKRVKVYNKWELNRHLSNSIRKNRTSSSAKLQAKKIVPTKPSEGKLPISVVDTEETRKITFCETEPPFRERGYWMVFTDPVLTNDRWDLIKELASNAEFPGEIYMIQQTTDGRPEGDCATFYMSVPFDQHNLIKAVGLKIISLLKHRRQACNGTEKPYIYFRTAKGRKTIMKVSYPR